MSQTNETEISPIAKCKIYLNNIGSVKIEING